MGLPIVTVSPDPLAVGCFIFKEGEVKKVDRKKAKEMRYERGVGIDVVC